MSTALVVIGGGALSTRALQAMEAVAEGAFVIAADSGLDHAVAAGLRPHVLVGDLDSISAAGRMWAYAHECEIDEHPMDKDATDTELALARAVAVPEVTDLLVLGGVDDGGEQRLDHLLGTLLSLGHAGLAALDGVRAVLGDTELRVLHPGRRTFFDDPGRQFSLLALHGGCSGVTVTGARWPLTDATLAGTEARGVSNEAHGTEGTSITVVTGVLTVVLP